MRLHRIVILLSSSDVLRWSRLHTTLGDTGSQMLHTNLAPSTCIAADTAAPNDLANTVHVLLSQHESMPSRRL